MNLINVVVIICASIILTEIIYCTKEYLVSRERWYQKFNTTIQELRNDFKWLELESKNMFKEINRLLDYFEEEEGGEK